MAGCVVGSLVALTELVLATADAPADLLVRVRGLLDEAFGGDFSDDDWEHTLGGWHVVVGEGDVPLAHAAVVPRVLEIGGQPYRGGYVEGVAAATERRGEGHGTRAVRRAGELLRAEYELGALSTDRHGFYARLGWERWHGPTYVRRGGQLVRTPEEDDGVMVLRLGASRGVDLTAPIACAARSGDDW